MRSTRDARRRIVACAFAAIASLCAAAGAWAQSAWQPQKALEVIVPTGAGGTNDQMARLIQRVFQEQKLVVFKANAESMTAMLGGHIHAVVSSVSAAMPHYEAGRTRILAIAAPQRQGGRLAKLPTMREQGIDATGISNWRGILGARGLNEAQVAFWSAALAKVVESEEWKKQLEANNVASSFLPAAAFAKWLAAEYDGTRAVMADLGLAK